MALRRLMFTACGFVLCQAVTFDVIVYGASPGGISAAIVAANGTGLRVALLEPSPHVGGMSGPGGIGLRDTADGNSVMNSVRAAWVKLNDAAYPGASNVLQPDEVVAQASWDTLVADPRYNITVVRNAALDEAPGAVTKSGRSILSIRTVDPRAAPPAPTTTWAASVFIDASYEADVLLASNTSYTYGREARLAYNESLAGVIAPPGGFEQFSSAVNPFWPNGSLVPGVEADAPPAGSADDRVMPSSYRACITNDPANRVAWPRPAGYDAEQFELLVRLAQANPNRTFEHYAGVYPYAGYPANANRSMRFDLCENGELSTDQPSRAYSTYVHAPRAVRDQIRAGVQAWVGGWAYTLATDPRVPDVTRTSASEWGLCADAWPTNGHWPALMYVREGARLVGDYVATEVNVVPGACVPESIALGAWSIDIHLIRRHNATLNGQPATLNEGEMGIAFPTGTGRVYELPYGVLLPRRAETSNLLVPVNPSATHVAFGSIRVEPTFMALGVASGAAAAIAATRGIDVHDVAISELQATIAAQGQCVHWPSCSLSPCATLY